MDAALKDFFTSDMLSLALSSDPGLLASQTIVESSIFFNSALLVDSPTQPLWKYLSSWQLLLLRVLLTAAITGMGVTGIVYTNWHNDGFCWYLHNTSMAISWLAMSSMTFLSLFPTLTFLNQITSSLFQLAISSQLAMMIILYSFYYTDRAAVTYENLNVTWIVDLMSAFDNLTLDALLLDWAVNSILFDFGSTNLSALFL